MSAVDDDPLRPYLQRRTGFDPEAMAFLVAAVLADRAAQCDPDRAEQGQYRRGALEAYLRAVYRLMYVNPFLTRREAEAAALARAEQAEVWADVLDGDLKAWINDPTEWSA